MKAQNENVESLNAEPPSEQSVPAGNHPLEVAARQGLGPLSPKASEIWHGEATPCVTCGQLVAREATWCSHCRQDLSPGMIEKMKAHAGPWYVLEHLRPFPGVNLERIVKQIRRGLITETSIVRGPATSYQWRFALETPGLCRYFGKCWKCTNPVGQSEANCQQCGAYLTFEPARSFASTAFGNRSTTPVAAAPLGDVVVPLTAATDPAAGPAGQTIGAVGGSELDHLRAVLSTTPLPTADKRNEVPANVGGVRVGWIAAGMVAVVIIALLLISQRRSEPTPKPLPARVTAPAEPTGEG